MEATVFILSLKRAYLKDKDKMKPKIEELFMGDKITKDEYDYIMTEPEDAPTGESVPEATK